jgi:hypothetical protein
MFSRGGAREVGGGGGGFIMKRKPRGVEFGCGFERISFESIKKRCFNRSFFGWRWHQ